MEEFKQAYIDYIDYSIEEEFKTYCPTWPHFLETLKKMAEDTDNVKLVGVQIDIYPEERGLIENEYKFED